ncbi:ethanolamine ammonia-lyase reactivating factor EutA [Scopulibacillus cellulosilyticus]|uniref:Ethanolamine ammonia-lyase reactivating factor EutA n=1 Tax=Scopulibacillus cellulosilyticus TaxID=2665665 RepID=A0ABW2PVL1_9BACL
MKRYVRDKEQMISAGIDIGTSTTKVVISRFSLMNTAGGTHMPRIEIVEKEILHQSPIFRTPLLSPSAVDIAAVENLVKEEYEKAGISLKDIKTGAIIITGETATKKNAEEAIHHLSNQAGEFLVATAGPDLESIIAAKGSGAYQYSKKTGKTIANIDIGGGTANTAVYRSGRLLGTCTLHIGGRLIEFENQTINAISAPVQKLINQKGLSITIGTPYKEEKLKAITDEMAAVISRMLNNRLNDNDDVLLLGHQPDWQENVDAIMFSGGIAECIYQFGNEKTHYDDIGMLLASSLKQSSDLSKWEWIKPEETVRATVLGAGTQTTEISGASIQVESEDLPVRNLPVHKIAFDYDLNGVKQKIQHGLEQALAIYDPFNEGQNFAVYLAELPYLKFKDIQELATSLIDAVRMEKRPGQPLVVAVESDFAKVLGQTINMQSGGRQRLICIDQIQVEHGDYLDIGQVLQSGVVPVVIKTLAFHN